MKVITDYHLEGMEPTPLNKWLWNLSTGNTLKLCFSIKRTLTRKVSCFLAIHCVPIAFCRESAKNYRGKVGLPSNLSWSRRHDKDYWKLPSNQGFSWKRPDVVPETSPGICLKDYFSLVVVVNFRPVVQTFDFCQLH